METRLSEEFRESPQGRLANDILRTCVHCGFCLATCPTYQLLGDELDSPRGRIYQIKQVLEGGACTRETQLHLDRCLTCRGCETTCPSGVQYGHLLEVGREAVDARTPRPPGERLFRWVLREGLSRPWLFAAALRVGRAFSGMLPRTLQAKLGKPRPAGLWPNRTHQRKILLAIGCTQPSMSPSIDAATARVLDAVGIQTIPMRGSGCCGAIRQHLSDPQGALEHCRSNIDAWWPLVESSAVEAIVVNASGCAAMVREYAHLLKEDPAYASKAERVAGIVRDPVQLLGPELGILSTRGLRPGALRLAFHPPCTLQHGLKIRGEVEKALSSLGAQLVPVADAHLCCGSAGTYSLLQSEISDSLRARKLQALLQEQPQMIVSANIGCIAHLQAATQTPVRHWLEWLDEALEGSSPVAS